MLQKKRLSKEGLDRNGRGGVPRITNLDVVQLGTQAE